MIMTQHDVQENQKEVAITADDSKEATVQNEKHSHAATTTESFEPDKSKSTTGDENKPVNNKAKSNPTHARTNDEEGKDSNQRRNPLTQGTPIFYHGIMSECRWKNQISSPMKYLEGKN